MIGANAAHRMEVEIDRALSNSDLTNAEYWAERYLSETEGEPMEGTPAQSPRFRSLYLAAQVALRAGWLRIAMDRLAPILEVTDRLSRELACRVWLISAEALARSLRHSEARAELAKAQDLDTCLRLNLPLKVHELRIRLWLGDVDKLSEELAACSESLTKTGKKADAALLACEEGCAWIARGDLTRAGVSLERAEALSRALGQHPLSGEILGQLASVERLRGQLQKAIDFFDKALSCVRRGSLQWQTLHLRRLSVLLDCGQWEEARAKFAETLCDAPLDQLPEEIRPLVTRLRVLLYGEAPPEGEDELQAYWRATRGDMEGARSLYLRAFAAAQGRERQARMALGWGMSALAGGDRLDAQTWLRRAEDLAREYDLPEVRWRGLFARGLLELDPNPARTLFDEAVRVAEAQARQLHSPIAAAAYRQLWAELRERLLQMASERGDAQAMFYYQELDRGMLLLELHISALFPSGFAASPDASARPGGKEEREADLGQRSTHGTNGGQSRATPGDESHSRLLGGLIRGSTAKLPRVIVLRELQSELDSRTVYVAPTIVDDDLCFLVVRRDGDAQMLRATGSRAMVCSQLDEFRGCVEDQMKRYNELKNRQSEAEKDQEPLGPGARARLDKQLEGLGDGPLGHALGEILSDGRFRSERLIWVPDARLQGLPVHALRIDGRYLVESCEVVYDFSGTMLVHRRGTKGRQNGLALVVIDSDTLGNAKVEGEAVAATFRRSRTLSGSEAKRATIQSYLPQAVLVHFACHAAFDLNRPWESCLELPSGELWYAPEWLEEPLDGLPLVTLSACRSGAVSALIGGEVFGLVTGFLAGGARAVLAGLWTLADRETAEFMCSFYRHCLSQDIAGALALAQREALASGKSSPLYWAPFALFGDAAVLPAPNAASYSPTD